MKVTFRAWSENPSASHSNIANIPGQNERQQERESEDTQIKSSQLRLLDFGPDARSGPEHFSLPPLEAQSGKCSRRAFAVSLNVRRTIAGLKIHKQFAFWTFRLSSPVHSWSEITALLVLDLLFARDLRTFVHVSPSKR